METTIIYFGNIRVILGLYRVNGKDIGNHHVGFRVYSLQISPQESGFYCEQFHC